MNITYEQQISTLDFKVVLVKKLQTMLFVIFVFKSAFICSIELVNLLIF